MPRFDDIQYDPPAPVARVILRAIAGGNSTVDGIENAVARYDVRAGLKFQ
ncbi:MAG TPA: hypothetical protein VFE47_30130 [Tepidisphaeraceae bacterium]|jgi:hypothetical protein|nr:hypothetical protein [Tepidisphaeraceae bacterium]